MPMFFLNLVLLLCGPPGWIVMAIIHFGRKNAASQQYSRQAAFDAAYIASGRTPPAKPLPDMSRLSERQRTAYFDSLDPAALAAKRAAWDALTPMQKLASNGRP